MKIFYLAFLVCCTFSLSAQYTASGNLKNDQGEMVEFANIVLYEVTGDKLVKGVVTDADGNFKIEKINSGNFYLKAMMLGYTDFQSEAFTLDESKTSHTLDMVLASEATMLDAVEVVAKVPLLEQRADRMVVNVAKSLTSVNGSLMEVMKKVPGMLVVNGKLSMAGNSNPTILIDGRTTQYMDIQSMLREMPADNIERIEVIHQPGAEFEASGNGPIINIILKKNKLYGTNGSVQFGFGKADRWRYNGGVNLNVRQGKLNFTGGAGYSYNAFEEGLRVDRVQDGNRFISDNQTPFDPKTYRANVGVDYYLTKKHTVGVGFRTTGSTNDRINTNLTSIDYADGSPSTLLATDNDLTRNWNYNRVNAYYAWEVDTLGQKLEIDGNFATFSRDATSLVKTTNKTGDNVNFSDVKNEQPGDTKIYTFKVDYTKPLSKEIQLQFGAKFSRADLDNDLQSFYFEDNIWKNNIFQSNHYLFEEDIAGVYAKLSFSVGKWEGTAGLRYEDSRSEGYSITLDSTNTRNIKKLFPSASLSRNLTEQLALSVAYSYRIERPQFHSLNPFVRYMDPFTLERGNPLLRPELAHSTKLSLAFENQPFFSLEYVKNNNIISLVTQQNAQNQTEAFDDNLDSYRKIGGSLFFPLSFIPGLDGYGGFMLFNEEYKDATRGGNAFNSNRWNFTSFLQANFKLPGEIRAEISGWYTGGGLDGIIEYEPMYGVSAGLQRSFLDKKLNVSLSFDDIVNRFFYGNLTYDDLNADIVSTWNNKIVSMRVTYKFGNQFMQKKKGRRNSAQEEVNRAKEDN